MISKFARPRFGIFGGTFDPPHVGHLILAMEAYDQLGLEKVLWVLTPDPPHKVGKQIAPIDLRLKMVIESIGKDPSFELSRIDLDRPGPHYVLETMKLLHAQFPQAELVFLMGGDSLRDLPTWRQPHEFMNACDRLGVMHRVGDSIDLRELEQKLPGITQKVEFMAAPILEISSNMIRQLISQGKPYRYYLLPGVYEIIKNEHLYLKLDLNHEPDR
jgi:nicotinate-nucleotide adenylyltransferase